MLAWFDEKGVKNKDKWKHLNDDEPVYHVERLQEFGQYYLLYMYPVPDHTGKDRDKLFLTGKEDLIKFLEDNYDPEENWNTLDILITPLDYSWSITCSHDCETWVSR
ncbi:hypothetical protein [Risungbinella massiliensis]|uniref:hypothetical protein n=1 Tax=Risungbinella massiliensis TaxID=1329796 RepID=UPI0011C89AFD|nr:hypothetical protein [Risungbinella massiliensis]